METRIPLNAERGSLQWQLESWRSYTLYEPPSDPVDLKLRLSYEPIGSDADWSNVYSHSYHLM